MLFSIRSKIVIVVKVVVKEATVVRTTVAIDIASIAVYRKNSALLNFGQFMINFECQISFAKVTVQAI